MKIEPTPNLTPHNSSPAAQGSASAAVNERVVWESLVPRLLDPSKLAIIQLLVGEALPLTPAEMAKRLEIAQELARYHCKAMERAGVLEVVDHRPEPKPDDRDPSYFFSQPPQATPTPASDPVSP